MWSVVLVLRMAVNNNDLLEEGKGGFKDRQLNKRTLSWNVASFGISQN